MQTDLRQRSVAEIPALTGIRGIAAVIVALAHTAQVFLSDTSYSNVVKFLPEDQAVDLFFVLSGFILCKLYGNRPFTWAFFGRFIQLRFARIWPLHLVTLLPALVKAVVVSGVGVGAIVAEVTMVHAWPIIGQMRLFNGPSWSVSIEWFAYLFVFPTLILAVPKISPKFAGGVVVILVCAEIAMLLNMPGSGSEVVGRGWFALMRGVFGFSIGFLCQYVCGHISKWKLFSERYLDLVIIIIVFYTLLGAIFPARSLWWIVCLAPLVVMGLNGKNNFTAICSWKPIHYLGEISYSIYLCHIPILNLSRAFSKLQVGEARSHISLWVLYWIFLLAAASVTYYFIELPARNWVRSIKISSLKQILVRA